MEKFSVLMSLYIKEKPEYFIQCMESVLNQTVMPEQIVIVKDGPLTPELENTLKKYTDNDHDLYTIVPLEKNMGLGLALAEGIKYCRNNLVARLDICGSSIVEFEKNIDNVVSKRMVPLNDVSIKKYQKRRDAFNHMTVMYKRDMVLRAGNYQSCLLMEDTLLWVHMILAGAKCKNIAEPLVYARVGKDMYDRRGGWNYYKKYCAGRKRVLETGYISWLDYQITCMAQLIVAIVPRKSRAWIFKKVLRKNHA